MTQSEQLPPGLPVPEDDGAADHLVGAAMPSVVLTSTTGGMVDVQRLGPARTIVYFFPAIGRPGVASPEGWDMIPGARGCTPEACGFRDRHGELAQLRAEVFGVSAQTTDVQREAAVRLQLPFPLLSDTDLELATHLRLPTFTVDGVRLYKRITLIVKKSTIEHVFYPVFPPDAHASKVGEWLRNHPRP